MDEICKHCRHLFDGGVTEALQHNFYCRRFPPTPVFRGNMLLGQHPPTQEDFSCGEFVPRQIAMS